MIMSMQKASQCPDSDIQGEYFSVSFRKGPYMNKQEDRVSKILKIEYIRSYLIMIASKVSFEFLNF